MRLKQILLISVMAIAWFAVVQTPATASHTTGFSMDFIVTDEQFTDYDSLSANKIQEFLNSQPGILKSYKSGGKSAARIISEAAIANRVSPKVLLVNIQKESSMITRTTFPSGQQFYLDWVMFYGWCDSCSSGVNKGFANQVNAAASAFRRYIDAIHERGYTISGWGPNITKSIPCIQSDYDNGRTLCTPGSTIAITPLNAATSALYTYTPHPGGNFAFWYIWNHTFNFSVSKFYPNGSLLRAQGSPNVWLISNGVKRRFTNSTAFLSRYSFSRVISVPADHLFVYDDGREISYANYSLLASPQGGVYLLVDDVKRPIISREAFRNAGFMREEIVRVDWSVLNAYRTGEPITTENIYPSGMLIQDNQTGAVFYVKDGIRYPIICREIMRSQFGLRRPIPKTPENLKKYRVGKAVGFKDGEIVSPGGPVYVISDGQKRLIANPETFNDFGFSWQNIIRVPAKCIDIHPSGDRLDSTALPVQSASR